MAKKKILLLSDDLRMASGIATMSKELVLGTVHKYDWFQVGAAINHPEAGKVLDVSEDKMLFYTLLTLVIGHGCMILNMKSDKMFLFYSTQFGMTCQTQCITVTSMKVVIG